VHTGGSQVACTKSRSGRRALEGNRTNVERRTNGRTAREIRNISRHDVLTAVRYFAAETAMCYCIAFCPGYTFRQPTYQTWHTWICCKTAYLKTTVFSCMILWDINREKIYILKDVMEKEVSPSILWEYKQYSYKKTNDCPDIFRAQPRRRQYFSPKRCYLLNSQYGVTTPKGHSIFFVSTITENLKT